MGCEIGVEGPTHTSPVTGSRQPSRKQPAANPAPYRSRPRHRPRNSSPRVSPTTTDESTRSAHRSAADTESGHPHSSESPTPADDRSQTQHQARSPSPPPHTKPPAPPPPQAKTAVPDASKRHARNAQHAAKTAENQRFRAVHPCSSPRGGYHASDLDHGFMALGCVHLWQLPWSRQTSEGAGDRRGGDLTVAHRSRI